MPVRLGELGGGLLDGFGELGVGEQWQVAAGELGEGAAELGFVGPTEGVNAGVDEECFEAGDSGGGEGGNVVLVAAGVVVADDAAPGHPVDPDVAVGGGALCIEGGEIQGFGDAVEGHVDEGGDAAGGSGLGGGGEAFPVGAGGEVWGCDGIVDVDVGVDEAGEEDEVGIVVEGGASWEVVPVRYGGDAAVCGVDGAGAHAGRRDDTGGAEDGLGCRVS